MGELVVSLDSAVVQRVRLASSRISLGRRAFNDVVLDRPRVSGEHAVIYWSGKQARIEDLNSSNGTKVNGLTVTQAMLADGDTIAIDRYRIEFLAAPGNDGLASRATSQGSEADHPTTTRSGGDLAHKPRFSARLLVLQGPDAGQELDLVKLVTTIGLPGVSVAAIARTLSCWSIRHVEGNEPGQLNGAPLQFSPVALCDGDVLELADNIVQFRQLSTGFDPDAQQIGRLVKEP